MRNRTNARTRWNGTNLSPLGRRRFFAAAGLAPVDRKANEITVFKQEIADFVEAYPFVKIVTGDALFAGDPLCSVLIRHGRHYVFQIKGDQKNLLEKMEVVFGAVLAEPAPDEALTGEKKRLRACA